MRKNIKTLEKEYEVENYCDYVMETALNGQWKSVTELVNEMRKDDLRDFAYMIWCGNYDTFSNRIQGDVLREVLNAIQALSLRPSRLVSGEVSNAL